MRRFFIGIFKIRKPAEKKEKNKDLENEVFLKEAGEQIRELARKGLSIPVFTL